LQDQKSSLADSARFIKQWIENPRLIGAVSPSGPALAKAMAGYVDLTRDGPIVELGPGTGPVTKALLARGIAPERLVLVEYEGRFCKMIGERYPGARIVQEGDAYGLKKTLEGKIDGRVATVVSSLPLLVRPERDRVALMHQAFELMGDDGLFIQFTYGLVTPMPLHAHELKGSYVGKGSAPILMNIPPARVWRYRKAGHAGQP
jgi:phosphatidylethanolamine/phosphatidyl-N-methylethanolamine N-methyltransferase